MKRGETSKCKKVTEKVKDKINRDVRFILKDKDVVRLHISGENNCFVVAMKDLKENLENKKTNR